MSSTYRLPIGNNTIVFHANILAAKAPRRRIVTASFGKPIPDPAYHCEPWFTCGVLDENCLSVPDARGSGGKAKAPRRPELGLTGACRVQQLQGLRRTESLESGRRGFRYGRLGAGPDASDAFCGPVS